MRNRKSLNFTNFNYPNEPNIGLMKNFYLLFTLTLYFLSSVTMAQEIRKVHGKYQLRMELNMTENDTRKLAEEMAKIDALQKTFGSIVDQEFNMMIESGIPDYNIISKTETKGEWVETTRRVFYEDLKAETTIDGERNIKWITCEIRGRAREVKPRAHIDFYPLNCPNLSCRTTEIVDDGNLYLYFRSPVDGYLSVFIDDGNLITRLLPDCYASKEFESGVFVKGDQQYIFFSREDNSLPQKTVEKYRMFTSKKFEFNYLYIVFSESQFVKPILDEKQFKNGIIQPKSLSSKEFQEWLAENRYASDSFQKRQIAITVKGK